MHKQNPTHQNTARWKKAQAYERQWWQERAPELDLAYYQAYADNLKAELNDLFKPGPESRILEIGSGAAGILTHLAGKRWAVEPMERFFAGVPEFRAYRDTEVAYHEAQAETLPFADKNFDLIIIDNVLDHCRNIDNVFSEMRRVLRKNGWIYMRLSTYTTWGKIIRKLVEWLRIDPGHPYTFTKRSLQKCITRHQFTIEKNTSWGHRNAWLRQLRSGNTTQILKALALVSQNKTTLILRAE